MEMSEIGFYSKHIARSFEAIEVGANCSLKKFEKNYFKKLEKQN